MSITPYRWLSFSKSISIFFPFVHFLQQNLKVLNQSFHDILFRKYVSYALKFCEIILFSRCMAVKLTPEFLPRPLVIFNRFLILLLLNDFHSPIFNELCFFQTVILSLAASSIWYPLACSFLIPNFCYFTNSFMLISCISFKIFPSYFSQKGCPSAI